MMKIYSVGRNSENEMYMITPWRLNLFWKVITDQNIIYRQYACDPNKRKLHYRQNKICFKLELKDQHVVPVLNGGDGKLLS